MHLFSKPANYAWLERGSTNVDEDIDYLNEVTSILSASKGPSTNIDGDARLHGPLLDVDLASKGPSTNVDGDRRMSTRTGRTLPNA